MRHNYKFSQELEMGMMNAIFKVSYENAMLATKLSFKTNQHAGRKKKKDKKHLSSFIAMLNTELSVVLFQ